MSTTESQTDAGAAIAAATAQFVAAFTRQDAAACAHLYTELGATLQPGADIVRGRAAIRAVWQEAFDAGLTGFRVESLEVESAGDLAYEVGRYAMYAGDEIADQGKYLLIWKREGGEWRIHRDMVNNSRSA